MLKLQKTKIKRNPKYHWRKASHSQGIKFEKLIDFRKEKKSMSVFNSIIHTKFREKIFDNLELCAQQTIFK